MATILVVDSDEAFSTMLEQILETEGAHAVEVAHSGRQALELLRRGPFNLTIIDMGLEPGDHAYLDLLHQVRQGWPAMRLVLIPFMGEELPADVQRVGIQGTLSKPFFVDDLLPAIEQALSRPVRPPEQARAATPSPPAPGSKAPASGVQPVLAGLRRETGADAALLIAAAPGREALLGHSSSLSKQAAEALPGLIVAAVRAAQAVGRALGQPDAPYDHNMFETATSRLYAMALPGECLLVVMTPTGTPLGTVRSNLRRAARELGGQAQ